MNKRLALLLPADLYSRLAAQAKAEDRDPTQQARVILRKVLALDDATGSNDEPADSRSRAASGRRP